MRGGSSKGLYFHAHDLPADPDVRNRVLVAAMGADGRQIDGVGGADPLTSKVAVVSPSTRDDADVDYLFVQVGVGEGRTDTTPNCGNMLAGVGPFAIETGLLAASGEETTIRVHMVNSGNLCELRVRTPDGTVQYDGDAHIDGVPGTSAPILCNYLDVAGSACGALLPTGNVLDVVDDVPVTCVDNGMLVVVLRAGDFQRSGYESRDELERSIAEAARYVPLERLALSPQCGFATSIVGNNLTLDDQRRKLELICQTARSVWS